MSLAAVILAAGQGTRMKSDLPKVLHTLGGRPMIAYSVAAATEVIGGPPVLVVERGADQVRQVVGDAARYVVQAEQLGTGHAAMQAEAELRGQAERVLVFYADMPLLSADTLRALAEAQAAHDGPFSMLTLVPDKPRGFGRIIRGDDGRVLAIVEEAQATPEQMAIREVNPGVYCYDAEWLWEHLPRIPLSPKGEYYLTDMVEIAVEEGGAVNALPVDDPLEALGINTRVHLAEAESALRQRINRHWMLEGVTILDPATTYIQPSVTLGRDTTVLPNTYLWGDTHIGSECIVGPNTRIEDSTLGDRCRVTHSVIEEATIEDECKVGPFGHLRPGAYLERGVRMGNFGEVKNSRLGQGITMGHFSYIGDAEVGAKTNIGAGTITCNYDGRRKNKTVIGRGVFIGSDTMLIAPVTVGDGARTGAGSVVTKDVPPDTLAVGVPARIRKIVPPDDED